MYTLESLVSLARKSSPFYRDLYQRVPETGWQLQDLPLVDLEAYRAANGFANNRVLTEPLKGAVVIKTGGTTGKTKLSYYTNAELTEICRYVAGTMRANGMEEGDRMATFLPAGQLYGSYLFTSLIFHHADLKQVVFHFGFEPPFEELLPELQEFGIDCLMGIPTMLLKLARRVREEGLAGRLPVRKIYYFGETMFHDTREVVLQAFPGALIRSSGYSSVDGALIGYVDDSCGFNIHRTPDGLTMVELLDPDTLETIHDTGKPGRIVITNLARGLMPIIRYPSGDMGRWEDPLDAPNRRFMLLGRAAEGVRMFGPVLYFNDVAGLLFPLNQRFGLLSFQMVCERREGKDALIVRLALQNPNIDTRPLEQEVLRVLLERYPFLEVNRLEGLMHPIRIECLDPDGLETSPRTGKTLRVIDRRLG